MINVFIGSFKCVFQDYKPDEDPALFHSEKTGRGPLGPGWKVHKNTLICAHTHALTSAHTVFPE